MAPGLYSLRDAGADGVTAQGLELSQLTSSQQCRAVRDPSLPPEARREGGLAAQDMEIAVTKAVEQAV